MMATFIRILGIFITVIFSTGAMIGAMITMYGSVANRTVEIGTMRALGFYRRSIMLAFLIESIVLSVGGGAIGLALASVLQFFTISTLNFGSFSELAFSFALSPQIIAQALGFSLLMGLLGGFFRRSGGAPEYYSGAAGGVNPREGPLSCCNHRSFSSIVFITG